MLKEFREFILRGNVLDLAVAVIMGAAFGAIIDSLVKDVIMNIIAGIGGAPDFSSVAIPFLKSQLGIGKLINAIIGFLVVAAALFFIVIKPVNTLMARMKKEEAAAPPAPSAEEKLLGEIRDLLKR